MRSAWTSLLFCAAVAAAEPPEVPVAAGRDGQVRMLVQSSPLAGSQYYALARLRAQIRVGDRLELRREPDNRHDANAVRVLWRGEPLGYLPRKENRAVARAMDRGEPVHGTVERMSDDPDPWQRLRIAVYVEL